MDCAHLLNDKGILYFSFVEGDYSKSGFQAASTGDRAYFYFHSLESLTTELTSNRFEIIKIYNKKYKKNITTEEVHSIIIARK